MPIQAVAIGDALHHENDRGGQDGFRTASFSPALRLRPPELLEETKGEESLVPYGSVGAQNRSSPSSAAPDLDSPLSERVTLRDIAPVSTRFASIPSEIRTTIRSWQRIVSQVFGPEVRWQMGGSLAAGHFWGPKDRALSSNPTCPKEFDRIIEVDGRFVLPRGVHPHDPEVVKMFAEIIGDGQPREPEFAARWGRDILVQRIYTYRPVADRLGLEFEVCLVEHDFLEVAGYWNRIFTKKEIDWQAEIRASLRAWQAEKPVVSAEKGVECDEARWRIVAGHAMHALITSGRLKFENPEHERVVTNQVIRAFRGKVPEVLQPLIDQWLRGVGGQASSDSDKVVHGLTRPHSVPAAAAREYIEVFHERLLIAPPPPLWVEYAAMVQRELAERALTAARQ